MCMIRGEISLSLQRGVIRLLLFPFMNTNDILYHNVRNFYDLLLTYLRHDMNYNLSKQYRLMARRYWKQRQIGSLAGAAHLLHDNADVLRLTQVGQKPTVEQNGKS